MRITPFFSRPISAWKPICARGPRAQKKQNKKKQCNIHPAGCFGLQGIGSVLYSSVRKRRHLISGFQLVIPTQTKKIFSPHTSPLISTHIISFMSLCLAQAYFGNAVGENLFLTWLLITIGATVFTLIMVWRVLWCIVPRCSVAFQFLHYTNYYSQGCCFVHTT
jgi:hypothetical protein